MTPRELNRDVKRLQKRFSNLMNGQSTEAYYAAIDELIKPEFLRLYDADREFKYFNAESIKILLRMNLTLRFVQLHQFGIEIRISE